MRILLAIASNRTRNDLAQALGARGHEVFTSSSRRKELLLAIEEARPVHAALLSQAALGGEWIRWLRQLRNRAPGVCAVVLLRPGAERHWRRAIMAGAFEALTASATGEDLLAALCRALPSGGAAPSTRTDARREGPPAARRANAPGAAAGALHRRQAS